MSPKLAALQRRMKLPIPEKEPAPAAIERPNVQGAVLPPKLALIARRLARQSPDTGEAESQPPAHVQRLLDQQFAKPAMPTSFDQLPPVARTKPMSPRETVVTQRDYLHRIQKLETRSLDGSGPVLVSEVMQRDEEGGIVRVLTTAVDESPVLPIDYRPKARKYDPGELR
jgi:hypothetical protein